MPETQKRTNLERFLWEHKITHAELSESSGVSRVTIWQLLKGNITEGAKQKVTEALMRIAESKGVPFDADGIWQ